MSGPTCTNQPETVCVDCTLGTRLMCRYDARDTLHFLMITLPFFVASIGGMITAGFGWWLFGWLGYHAVLLFCLGGAHPLQPLPVLGGRQQNSTLPCQLRRL